MFSKQPVQVDRGQLQNGIVGSPDWIDFLLAHADRVVVGLSIGTTDDNWAIRVEIGTSLPSARIRALRNLQDAGIPTFATLCPVTPAVLVDNSLEQLVASVRPELCEDVWAEPYNDHQNWKAVRDGHEPGSEVYNFSRKRSAPVAASYGAMPRSICTSVCTGSLCKGIGSIA